MPDNFDLSDQISHPNICGFGKSLLEACMEGQVKELVLVNCCDTIRSAYDVLLESGKLDFLFMLDMLHSGRRLLPGADEKRASAPGESLRGVQGRVL